MPTITLVENSKGDVFYGFDADGTFIPFGGIPAHRIKALQDRAADLKALSDSDDPDAKARHDEAADATPYDPKGHNSKASKATSKGGES